MEGEPEQSLLPVRRDQAPDVEERRRAALAVLEHEDPAALLDDVEPAGLALRAGDEDRLLEPTRDGSRREGGPIGLLGRGAGGARGPQSSGAGECEQRPHWRAR
jgi:hypothetical protein